MRTGLVLLHGDRLPLLWAPNCVKLLPRFVLSCAVICKYVSFILSSHLMMLLCYNVTILNLPCLSNWNFVESVSYICWIAANHVGCDTSLVSYNPLKFVLLHGDIHIHTSMMLIDWTFTSRRPYTPYVLIDVTVITVYYLRCIVARRHTSSDTTTHHGCMILLHGDIHIHAHLYTWT